MQLQPSLHHSTLHQCALLSRGRADGYLDDTLEVDNSLGNVAVEEVERFNVVFFLELSQLLQTVVEPLLKVNCFGQAALLEKAETIAVVAQLHSQPMQHPLLEYTLVFHIPIESAPHAV